MFFRLESHAQLYVSEGDTMQLSFQEHKISVRLRQEFRYDDEIDDKFYFLNVTAQGIWELDSEAEVLFQHLANDELPPGTDPPELWVNAKRQEFGRVTLSTARGKGDVYGYVPELKHLSASAQRVIATIQGDLADKSRYAIDLVRWRFGIRGSHEPLEDSLFQWSLDGKQWKVVPFASSRWWSRIEFQRSAKFAEPIQQELQAFIANGQHESLGHSLLREAWEQREQSPRSALVIGMAAAEVGFKQFANEVAPTLGWLIEKRPLPLLLRNYLPELLKDREDLPCRSLPEREVIEPIEKQSRLGTPSCISPLRRETDMNEHGRGWLIILSQTCSQFPTCCGSWTISVAIRGRSTMSERKHEQRGGRRQNFHSPIPPVHPPPMGSGWLRVAKSARHPLPANMSPSVFLDRDDFHDARSSFRDEVAASKPATRNCLNISTN
jgi:hypothetical protein